jgi:AraC family transcriptional regulator
MNQRVKPITDLIANDLRREMPLSSLARCVNLSPSRLRHLFKVEIGMAPYQYLKSLRMLEAKKLLETTFLNVKEIICKVGAHDQGRFSQDFKKTFGMTPCEYREQYRENLEEVASVSR